MNYRQTFSELVGNMTGKNTLNGWDALMSYDQTVINQMLQQRGKAMGILDPIVIERQYRDELNGVEVSFSAILYVANPTLQFVNGPDAASLTFNISGTYGMSDGPTLHLPDLLQLVITCSLVYISGNFDLTTSTTPGAGPSDPGDYINFLDPSNKNQKQGVSLSFNNAMATLAGSLRHDPITHMLQFSIAEYFQQKPVRYTLFGADMGVSTGEIGLKPAAMCMTVSNDDKGAVLHVWMMLQGLPTNGTLPSVRNRMGFYISGQTVNPIPAGCNASLIFSQAAFANMVVTPLMRKMVENVTCTSGVGDGGLSFEFTPVLPVGFEYTADPATVTFPAGSLQLPTRYKFNAKFRNTDWPMDGPLNIFPVQGACKLGLEFSYQHTIKIPGIQWTEIKATKQQVIDYTALTNVLFPGISVFLPDEYAFTPDNSLSKGQCLPCDMIITGSIIIPSTTPLTTSDLATAPHAPTPTSVLYATPIPAELKPCFFDTVNPNIGGMSLA